jgi:hypothetical protein
VQEFVEIEEAEEAEEIESIVGMGGKMSARREREDYIGDLDVARGPIARCITGSRISRRTTIQPSCLNAVSPFNLLTSVSDVRVPQRIKKIKATTCPHPRSSPCLRARSRS